MRAVGEKGLAEIVMATYAGMSTEEFKYVFDGGAAPTWAGSNPPSLERLPESNFVDDNVGKPVGIPPFIGRRPILAFDNSGGDKQMLGWTAAGNGIRFMGLVHHTDAAREYAYDRDAKFGRLDKALDEAAARGWTIRHEGRLEGDLPVPEDIGGPRADAWRAGR